VEPEIGFSGLTSQESKMPRLLTKWVDLIDFS
jgi:hypothetical protein